jgi:hypothetical protein
MRCLNYGLKLWELKTGKEFNADARSSENSTKLNEYTMNIRI